MRKPSIRTAILNDIPALLQLISAVHLKWEPGDTATVLSKKLLFDPSSIIVLELDGSIIGMAMTIYDPWASSVWHVAVEPVFQGRGFGHLIADEAEKRLRARGTTSVSGFVLGHNKKSLAYFRKRKYKTVAENVVVVERDLSQK